jgi:hypothetical protein
MKARGFITTLGAVLAGASIGLAAPAVAAPEGPDSAVETGTDQQIKGIIVVDRPGSVSLNRTRVSGVQPGLEPQRLTGETVLLEFG